jgi:hypothetical protein
MGACKMFILEKPEWDGSFLKGDIDDEIFVFTSSGRVFCKFNNRRGCGDSVPNVITFIEDDEGEEEEQATLMLPED